MHSARRLASRETNRDPVRLYTHAHTVLGSARARKSPAKAGLSLDHEGRRNASNGSPRLTVARSQPALNPIALAARRIAAANTPPARQPATRRSRAAEQCDELAPPHAGHRAPSQVPRPILPAKDAERRQFRRTLGLPLEGQPALRAGLNCAVSYGCSWRASRPMSESGSSMEMLRRFK